MNWIELNWNKPNLEDHSMLSQKGNRVCLLHSNLDWLYCHVPCCAVPASHGSPDRPTLEWRLACWTARLAWSYRGTDGQTENGTCYLIYSSIYLFTYPHIHRSIYLFTILLSLYLTVKDDRLLKYLFVHGSEIFTWLDVLLSVLNFYWVYYSHRT